MHPSAPVRGNSIRTITQTRERIMDRLIFAVMTLIIVFHSAQAQTPDYAAWRPLVNPFESTGGGGVMIDDYRPVVANGACTTDFSVKMPDGARFLNEIVFEARPVQGGILCTNGKWRAKDGSSSGTTPFEMFIKDGMVKRSP
jgi:hypothetical protein